MARVSSRIQIDRMAIKRLNQAAVRALEETGEWLHTQVIQATVIPRDSGTLQGEGGTFVDYSNSSNGHVSLVSSTPYARRLYFNPEGWHMHTEKNPNAKDHWLEDWTEDGQYHKNVAKAYAAFYKQEARL